MNLIKFSNGKWGIKRYANGMDKYLDFKSPTHWWTKSSEFIVDCMVDEAIARKMFDTINFTDGIVE